MHLKLFLLLSLSFIGKYVQCQQTQRPAIVWNKWYGGSGIDRAEDVLLTADGGMIVAGSTASNDGDVTGNHGGNDGWVIKLNAAGQKEWQRAVGGTKDEGFNSIIKCNGGYLCVGYTSSNDGDIINFHNNPNPYKRDCLVVKLSDSGTVLWSKAFGGFEDDAAKKCVETSDGNYIIIGDSYSLDGDVNSDPNNLSGAWIFKVSPSGNILWENSLLTSISPQLQPNEGYDIIETYDHQLLAYASRYRTFDTSFYTPIAQDDTVIIYDTVTYTDRFERVGVLYSVDKMTGIVEPFLETEGDAAFSMKQMPNGIYLSYINYEYVLNDENNTGSGLCSNETSYITRLNRSTGTFYPAATYSSSCQYDGGMYVRYGPALNGSDGIENGHWLQVGSQVFTRSWCGGQSGYVAISRENGYRYGGTAYDGFTAVQAFSNGYEFVCAGYASSVDGDLLGHGPVEAECNGIPNDFWIVKLSATTNRISGNVFFDENNNNVKDSNEHAFTKGMVKIKKPGFDVSNSINAGYFMAEVDTGSFVTQLVLNNPDYYSAVPVSDTSVFNNHFSADTVDFAVHKNGDFTDNAAMIFATNNVRPGRAADYLIRLFNNGTVTSINKPVRMIKDNRFQFSSASITPVTISGDTITWNIDTLNVDGTKLLQVSLLADIPPVVDAGDTVYASIFFDTTADMNVSDNIAWIKQIVTNAFDPNDKQEIHAGAITKLEVQQANYLTYTIRFQNTGNDTAFNIIIRDALDEKLIAGTFEMISASHDYQLKIKDGKHLSWEFNDVMLVDSNHNEPASHGFITYRIKPESDLAIGDVINNSASIYFDFNPPVITNTERTAVVKTIAIWTGAKNSAWDNKGNWNINAVPDGETVAIIPANVPNYPVVNNDAICFSLKIDSNASITVNSGFWLNITGK